jgi:four helix bundle protein
MPTFRDLWIWKESHQLMLEIHQYARTLPREERFRKRDQIERSSSSVPDNISEGYTAYYYNDKIKGMLIARKEAGETQNHIEALTGKGYLPRNKADNWINRYERIMAGINSYVNFIRDKRKNTGSIGQGKRSGISCSGSSRCSSSGSPDVRIS